jgi:hypothetical protein
MVMGRLPMVEDLLSMVGDLLSMVEDLHPVAGVRRPMATHLMRLTTDPMVQAPAHPIAET